MLGRALSVCTPDNCFWLHGLKKSNGERKLPTIFLAYCTIIKYDMTCHSHFCITVSLDWPLEAKINREMKR